MFDESKYEYHLSELPLTSQELIVESQFREVLEELDLT